MSDEQTLLAQVKWLRLAADEIATAGHNGWGNTCAQAAFEIENYLVRSRQESQNACRYEWLKDAASEDLEIITDLSGEDWDTAIDAAMSPGVPDTKKDQS